MGRYTGLSSTACTSTTHCVAVGESSPPQGLQPAAALWNGHGWTMLSLGTLDAGGTLDDVSCPSASSCMAAGSQSADPDLLLESWNGTSWHVMTGANPGSVYAVLTGVSCGQVRSCVSVGGTQVGYNGPAAILAERWDGTVWHLTAAG